MTTKPTPSDLDTMLRDGARDRRATLDGLAPAYPVGDYPPRSAEHRAQATGPGVLARVAWLIGLSGVSTAALLGLVTLVSVILVGDPTQPSAPLLANQPRPDTLGTSVRSLVAGLGELEARMNQQMDPSVDAATAWSDGLVDLPGALVDAEDGLQNPIEQEFIALSADLQTAAANIREQWTVTPPAEPTGRGPLPEASPITG